VDGDGHGLCRAVLRDPRFRVEPGGDPALLDLSLLELDAPDHTAAAQARPRTRSARG
jgi:hypothetical protein